MAMKDINGIGIKIGDTVKSTQPTGGILSPAPAQKGIVVEYEVSWKDKPELAIKYLKPNSTFYQYILLEGKINEIIID